MFYRLGFFCCQETRIFGTLYLIVQKRTQYVVAAGFQFRFALLLIGVAALVTLVVGFQVYRVLFKTQALLMETGVVLSPQVIDFIRDQKSLYIHSLFWVFVGVTLLLLVFSIFISHRLAGPIFALTRKMNELAAGNFNATVNFRKGDEFQELKERYNTLVHALQNQVKSELIKLDEIIRRIEVLISRKDATLVFQQDLRATLNGLQAYYIYKKNLLEPQSATSFSPKKATEEEILI